MSREIKFRAWDKAFDKMINFNDTLAKEWILGLTLWGDVIGCDLKALEPKSSHETYIITYPERFELMQYTGLKDKNGQEIYEGDICVHLKNPWGITLDPFRVAWDENNSCWSWMDLETGESDMVYQSITKSCEVIGNIHDNPKLLKEVTP